MRKLNFIFLLLIPVFIFAQPDYTSWDKFLKKHVSASGYVDYNAIKAEKKTLQQITQQFSAQTKVDLWAKNERLAFWINSYNAYTIQLIVDNFPISSIQDLDKGKTWDVKRITVNGKKYSLNNIENDIIRKQFKDPRIHFALNCGAISCPPLLNKAYLPKTLDVQLETQTKNFFTNKLYQQISPTTAKISKIMDWYKSDFGNIVNFINKYSIVKVSSKTKIEYLPYDWALNIKK